MLSFLETQFCTLIASALSLFRTRQGVDDFFKLQIAKIGLSLLHTVKKTFPEARQKNDLEMKKQSLVTLASASWVFKLTIYRLPFSVDISMQKCKIRKGFYFCSTQM